MTTQSLAIPNAAQIKSPAKSKAQAKAKSRRRRLEKGSISYEDWLKTPTALAIQKWEEENPEEAEKIRLEVLKECGLID